MYPEKLKELQKIEKKKSLSLVFHCMRTTTKTVNGNCICYLASGIWSK